MSGQQLPIPGTEPTSRDLARARHRLRREHIRHRMNNLSARLMSLGAHTHALGDKQCDTLEDMLARIEDTMNKQGDA